MRRRFLLIAAIGVVLGAGGVLVVLMKQEPASRHAGEPAHPVPKPTLYCDFFNFMHNATVVSFYFGVDLADRALPKYSELFVVENESDKTDFGGAGQPLPPQWSYKVEDGTPTIVSPDAATAIVLYGLKPTMGGVFWIEAGVRSNDYRNLEGKCRQAHYGPTSGAGRT